MLAKGSQVYIGFDFGLRYVGVAVGQTITITATPITVLLAKNGKPNWQEVEKIILEWHPDGLVVGIPTEMGGKDLPITQKARDFADELRKRFSLPVFEADERLTTKDARATIFATGGYKALQKKTVDSIAAKIILEAWMHKFCG